jgi:hypothetical protein
MVFQNLENEPKMLGIYWKKPSYELYNLVSDPKQRNDISSQRPEVLNSLKEELNSYMDYLINNNRKTPEGVELDDLTIRRLRTLGYIE